MTRNKLLVLALAAISGSAALDRYARPQLARAVSKPPSPISQFVGGGRWESSRHGNGQQGWHVQMKHFDDNSLAGRVNLVGAVFDHANIQGLITGQQVEGVLLDDNENQVGTFSGVISTSGISGTYTTANGDSGNWTWDGQLPGKWTN